MLGIAASAPAQDDADAQALADVLQQRFDQVVYKGLVGKVLDGIPIDPVQRVGLLALPAPSAAAEDASAERVPEPVLLSLLSDEDSGAAASAASRVVKVWLPQRVPTLPR